MKERYRMANELHAALGGFKQSSGRCYVLDPFALLFLTNLGLGFMASRK